MDFASDLRRRRSTAALRMSAEEYRAAHASIIKPAVHEAIKAAFESRPGDPLLFISRHLAVCAASQFDV